MKAAAVRFTFSCLPERNSLRKADVIVIGTAVLISIKRKVA